MNKDDWSYHTPIAKKLLATGEAQLALGDYRGGELNLRFAVAEIEAALAALEVKCPLPT